MDDFNAQLKTLTLTVRNEVNKLPVVYFVAMPTKVKLILSRLQNEENTIDYFELFLEACQETKKKGSVHLEKYEQYLKPYPVLFETAKLYLDLIEDWNNGSD